LGPTILPPLTLEESLETTRTDSLDGKLALKQSLTELGLSARAHDKILRLRRTIADLTAHENITADDICEAGQYPGSQGRCGGDGGLWSDLSHQVPPKYSRALGILIESGSLALPQ
jgi:predicted ATPase with chaperone activity